MTALPVPTRPTPAERAADVANIRATYAAATPDQLARGAMWYRVAHDLAAMIADGDVARGAGVIAALSPKNAWAKNAEMAAAACRGEPVGYMRAALAKVAKIMAGADPAEVLPMGAKTGNFYRNIVDPSDPDPVTIDRHAHDVAYGAPLGDADRGLSNLTRYAVLAHAYRTAAADLGVLPNVLQSVVWIVQTERTTP